MPTVTAGPNPTVRQLVESVRWMCRFVVDVVGGATPDVRAVSFAGSEPLRAAPAQFVPRAGLDLILHAHDVCAGLGLPCEPDADIAERVRHSTRPCRRS